MKKIALLLALMMVATMCLASCNNTEDTPSTTTPAATTTTAGTTTTKTPPPVIEPEKTDEEEDKAPELADSTKFALDGSLAEWEGLHTISVIGEKANDEADYSHKKVTFYGVLTDAGLYLASEAYHDIYIGNSGGDWWTNTNLEFFVGIGRGTQMYVYAKGEDQDCGTSGETVQAKMVTEVLTDGPTTYHTITEAFIPMAAIETEIMYNTVDVGIAWKTLGDLIIGGHGVAGPNGEDEYWVPKGNFPWDSPKPIVAPSGIYLPSEYEF